LGVFHSIFTPFPQIRIIPSFIFKVYLPSVSLSFHLAYNTHKFCLLYQCDKSYGARSQNDTREDFLGMWHSLLSQLSLFLLPDPASLYFEEYVYICVQTVFAVPLLPTFLHKTERCAVLSGFCRWGAGLAVTGLIRDIGQNVLQSSETGSGRSAQLLPHMIPYCIPG
jgi:hypothetical protein